MESKNKKILILPAPDKLRAIKEFMGSGIDITRGNFSDIEFRFNCEMKIFHKGIDIKEFDFVWLSSFFSTRGISRALSLYLSHHDVAHTNVNYGEGTSKLVDLTHFDLNNLPLPNTIFRTNPNLEKQYDLISKFCGYPLIIKSVNGSRGKYNFLVNSPEELKKVLKKLPIGKSCVLQQFIPNDYDWGIIVANGTVVSAEKSYHTEDDHRNNACWGAKESFENIDTIEEELKEIAIKSCEVLNLEWGRADIIIDKYTKRPYLLEVNRFPGMTPDSTEVGAFCNYLQKSLIKENILE